MKHNVLVFPCGSEIGLEVRKSLEFSTHFNLFGGSSVNDHGKFVYKNYISDVPYADDPDFLKKINDIVDRYKIEFIIPAHDSVLLKLAQEKAIGNLKCKLVTSPVSTCEVARSKLKTYDLLQNIIPTPKVYKNIENLEDPDFPIFLKPDVGQGSKGTYLAKTKEDIEFYAKKDSSLLLLEYLPGPEYTIDCLTNRTGELLFCEGRERKRISNGISVNSISVDDSRFRELANKINEQLELRGVWFFQVKERENKDLVLMEIAPRIAGTMGLVRAKGVNLTLLSLFDAMDYDVDVFENHYNITIDRALDNKYLHDIYYSHVYLDFDDLVIFENKVNPQVMAFVYQCHNKNIVLHLITKHKEVLEHTLEKYKLSNVFDERILVKADEEKYLHIKHKDAIFIDDSFAERKKVHEKCGIPTFDGHMIEALMEKF